MSAPKPVRDVRDFCSELTEVALVKRFLRLFTIKDFKFSYPV